MSTRGSFGLAPHGYRYLMQQSGKAWAEADHQAMGERIRHARDRRGFSLQAVADRLGVSKGTVGHWETGVRAIKHDDLARLCALLQISADEVLFGTRRWPFNGINFDLVNDLDQKELGMLEGAMLQLASSIGFAIRPEAPPRINPSPALAASAGFRKEALTPTPPGKPAFNPPALPPTRAAPSPGTSQPPSSPRSARKPSQPAKVKRR